MSHSRICFFMLSLCGVFTVPIAAQTELKKTESAQNRSTWGAYGYSYQQQLVYFLMSPNIQKEIELSADQKQQLTDANKRLREGYKEIYAKYPELRDPKLDYQKRSKINRTVQLEYSKLRSQIDEELRESLVPQQLTVLKKLQFNRSVQSYGFSATVSRKPFQEEIETTDSQREKLKKILQETEAEIRKLAEQKRKAAKEKMLKVLDAKQREKVKELEGDAPKPGYTRL